MFISGYYGIRFSVNKALEFVLQAFLINLFIIGIKLYNEEVSWNFVVQHLFPVANNNWWFLTAYFCIMLLAPIINKGIQLIDKKLFLFILLYLLFINSFGHYLIRISLGYNLFSLLIIYLLGRYLSIYKIEFARWKVICIYLIATSLLILGVCLFYFCDFAYISWLLYSYNNPLIMLQAICIFYLVKSLKERHYAPFIFLGKHCFLIYLITEACGLSLYLIWASYYNVNPLYGIGCILLTMFLCMSADCALERINRLIRKCFFKHFPCFDF